MTLAASSRPNTKNQRRTLVAPRTASQPRFTPLLPFGPVWRPGAERTLRNSVSTDRNEDRNDNRRQTRAMKRSISHFAWLQFPLTTLMRPRNGHVCASHCPGDCRESLYLSPVSSAPKLEACYVTGSRSRRARLAAEGAGHRADKAWRRHRSPPQRCLPGLSAQTT